MVPTPPWMGKGLETAWVAGAERQEATEKGDSNMNQAKDKVCSFPFARASAVRLPWGASWQRRCTRPWPASRAAITRRANGRPPAWPPPAWMSSVSRLTPPGLQSQHLEKEEGPDQGTPEPRDSELSDL